MAGRATRLPGALAGTFAANDGWMRRKASFRLYDASSQLMRTQLALHGVTELPAAMGLDPTRYALAGGAVPIRIGATQIGVVAASGVSNEVEHDLVTEVLTEHLGR